MSKKIYIFLKKYPLLIIFTSLVFLLQLTILLNSSITLFSDDAIYAQITKMFLEQGFSSLFHPTWPPLFPLVSAFFYLFTQKIELALQTTSLISYLALLVPLFFLGKLTLERTFTPFICSVIFLSPLFMAALTPLSDTLFTTLLISSLTLSFFYIHSKNQKFIYLSGLFFGLSYLTRSEGSLYFGLTCVFLSLYSFLKPKNFKNIAIYAAIFFITISPYVFYIRIAIGEWTLSHKFAAQIQQGHAFGFKNNTTWSQEVVSVKSPNLKSDYFRNGPKFVEENFDYLVWWFGQKLPKWLDLYRSLFPWWFFLLASFGLFKVLKKNLAPSIAYLLFIASFSFPITVFSTAVSEIRYLLWTIPLLYLFFWMGLDYLINHLSLIPKNTPVSRWLMLFITLIALFNLRIFNWNTLKPIDFAKNYTEGRYRQEFIQVADWLKNQSINNPKVMLRHEWLEYLADGQTIYTPQASLENTLQYAKNKEIDFLVAVNDELASDPNLNILLDPAKVSAFLKVVYITSSDNPKIIVYTINP